MSWRDEVEESASQLVGEARWAEAVELLCQHPALVIQDSDLSQWLGVGYLMLGRTSEAIAHLRASVNAHPGHTGCQGVLALALINREEAAEAEAVARRALDTADTVLLRSVLGMALRLQAKQDDASRVYQDGLAAHPGDSEMLRVLGDFLADTMGADEAAEFYAAADRLENRQ